MCNDPHDHHSVTLFSLDDANPQIGHLSKESVPDALSNPWPCSLTRSRKSPLQFRTALLWLLQRIQASMLVHCRRRLRKSTKCVRCLPTAIRSRYLIHLSKKLQIETKRQRPATAPTRKSTGGSFKQPYSADPRSPSGYLTPITPIDRGLHSAGGAYHHTRSSDLLGSPLPTSRSVYSPDSTSPTVPASRIVLFTRKH